MVLYRAGINVLVCRISRIDVDQFILRFFDEPSACRIKGILSSGFLFPYPPHVAGMFLGRLFSPVFNMRAHGREPFQATKHVPLGSQNLSLGLLNK